MHQKNSKNGEKKANVKILRKCKGFENRKWILSKGNSIFCGAVDNISLVGPHSLPSPTVGLLQKRIKASYYSSSCSCIAVTASYPFPNKKGRKKQPLPPLTHLSGSCELFLQCCSFPSQHPEGVKNQKQLKAAMITSLVYFNTHSLFSSAFRMNPAKKLPHFRAQMSDQKYLSKERH